MNETTRVTISTNEDFFLKKKKKLRSVWLHLTEKWLLITTIVSNKLRIRGRGIGQQNSAILVWPHETAAIWLLNSEIIFISNYDHGRGRRFDWKTKSNIKKQNQKQASEVFLNRDIKLQTLNLPAFANWKIHWLKILRLNKQPFMIFFSDSIALIFIAIVYLLLTMLLVTMHTFRFFS